MRALEKAALIAIVFTSSVGCDQITKSAARNQLASSQPIHLLGDLFRFHYTENTGVILGLGSGLPGSVRFWSFVVFVGAILLFMLRFVWTSQEMNRVVLAGVSLIIGGGFSNLLDRLLRDGAVVDFMNVGLGNLRTGIFNLADVAIFAGAGIVLANLIHARVSSNTDG